MRRLAIVVTIALAGFAAAIVIFNDPAKKGCPLAADEDSSYSGRFVGPVSMDQTRHVVQVTKNGTPLSGAKVCVNTEMVGMSGMGYSAKGSELGPGRYQIGFQFGMAGKYRGNLVTNEGGHEVSIPLLIKVASSGPKSGGMESGNGK